MLLRRFSCVLITALLVFGVARPSYSFAPAVGAVAFNSTVGRAALTFLAEEVAVKVIARGFSTNEPYYGTTAKAPKSRFVRWLKSGGAKRNVVLASIVASLGLLMTEDGSVSRPLPTDPYLHASYLWSSGSLYASPQDWALFQISNNAYASSFEIVRIFPDNPNAVNVVLYRPSGDKHSSRRFDLQPCAQYSSTQIAAISTCQPGFHPEQPVEEVTDNALYSMIINALSALDPRQINAAFSDAKGNLERSFAEILDVPEPATMPDQEPLPAIGAQLWTYADWLARGVAQTTNPALDYYVPPSALASAQYLAQKIALGNQTITSSNANNEPIKNPGNDTSPGSGDLDFGSAPSVATPSLEAAPTGEQILSPLLTLFPSLTSFSAPQHASECPRPSFQFYGDVFTVDAHCDLLQQHHGTLSAAMLLVFSILSLRIVLSA